jgi:hypothetical protein
MRKKNQPISGENQPIDLRGCRSVPVANTGIRLLVPSKEAASRLSEALNVPSRLKAVRQAALRGIGDRELFVQDCLLVGLSEDDQPVHLISSLLVSKRAWRGGWFLIITPVADAAAFSEYLAASRAAVTADLRKERAQRGSKN